MSTRTVRSSKLWQQDQVLAILREHDGPMTATEVGRSLAYMHAFQCRRELGLDGCYHRDGDPGIIIDGTRAHVRSRGHTTSSCASDILRSLATTGAVAREKVDRRLLWSIHPDHAKVQHDLAEAAWAILSEVDLPSPTAAELETAQRHDAALTDMSMLDDVELQKLVDEEIRQLQARGIEFEWTQDPHRAEADDEAWTAAVSWRSNGPLLVTTVSLWEGASLARQVRALRHASRVVSDPSVREAHPDGCVLR